MIILMKLIKACFLFTAAMKILLPEKATENSQLLCVLLSLAGDVLFLCIHRNLHRDSIAEELSNLTEDQLNLSQSVSREIDSFGK